MSKFHCIIADDEPLIRQGLASFIENNFPEIGIAASFEDGAQALDYIKSGEKVDIAILDIKMITVSGLEVSQYIFDNKLPIKVIAITGYREFDYAITAFNQRVEGILLKPISFEKLEKTLSNIIGFLKEERNIILSQKQILIEREINRNLLKKAIKIPYDNLTDTEKKQFSVLNNNYSGFVLEVKMQSNIDKWDDIRHHFFGELLTDNPDVYFVDSYSNVIILIGLVHKAQLLSHEIIDDYIIKLQEEMEKNGIFVKYDIKTYSSLREIFREATVEKDANEKRLDNILKYIEDNFHLEISLETIAGKFFMSKEYFSRFFKRHMSTSFVQYLAEYRIEKAKELILKGYSLNQVAAKVGYKNYKNFSKRFKEIAGIAPKEYRQQRR